MSPTPAPVDLTTVAAVQSWLALAPDADVDLLQSFITGVSAFFETYTGRSFQSQDYSEIRDGNDRDSLVLFNRPISSVSSVTIDGQSISSSTGWPQPGYYFTDTCIILRDRVFCRGGGNISIAYSAGYTAVPSDLAQACIDLVAVKYKLLDKTGVVSESMMQQTTTYSQKDMPSTVSTVLDNYRRYF